MSAGDTCRHPTGSLVNFYEYLKATSDKPDRCEWKQYCAECGETLCSGWDPTDDVNAPPAERHQVAVNKQLQRLCDWEKDMFAASVEAAGRRYRADG